MLHIPTILIHIDPEKDAEKLWKFLNHPQFPQLRTSNLNAHPQLKENANKENFQEIVQEYVKSFYTDHAEKINIIYEHSRDLVERNAAHVFQELSRLMNYEWEKETTYDAYLSILTGSTFDKDIFTYSILGELYGKNEIKKSLLSVGIHEISHLIFFELLEPIEQKHSIALHQDGKYFLKEALTTALLNIETLRSVLETEEDPGNPEIQQLYITTPQNTIALLKEYIRQQVLQSKLDNKPFNTLLEELVLATHSAEQSLNDKRTLWNKNGPMIFKNPVLLEEYKKPINFSNKRTD